MHHIRGGIKRCYESVEQNAEISSSEIQTNSNDLNEENRKNILNKKEFQKSVKENCDNYVDEILSKKRCTFEYLITPMKWMNLNEYQGKVKFEC